MNWITSEYNEERGCKVYTIKHEKLLKFLGFRLQHVADIDGYEFRMSFLRFGYSPDPMIMSTRKLAIPIPFMKRDHGIYLGKSEQFQTYSDDGKDYTHKSHIVFNLRFF